MKDSRKPTARRTRAVPIGSLAVAGVLAAAVFLFFGSRRQFGSPGSWKGLNVLVITIDTLRADRLGAYGFAEIRTPAIDSLAANGVLFENCITPAPLTLPAHTSLFTGTYPLRHGVRDNGGFVVPPQATTLAELFRERAYATAAFVGSFVLDSRWGLEQGFGKYGDDFDLRQEGVVSLGDIERPGNEVMDAALAWLRSHDRRRPFFLWVHLYDPHSPYDPPSPFREEYPGRPYLGEIAFTDSQIARLLDFLDRERLRERTAIVFAGDHGESFGEHDEKGHGFFIYQPTLHVPLIISAPSGPARRRPETVSLIDVFPTVVELTGLTMPAAVQGTSLTPLLSGRGHRDSVPIYSETYFPRMHYGWSPLKSLQDGRFKLIESSDPELYDLSADSAEVSNLAATDRTLYLDWKRREKFWLDRWSRDALPNSARVEDPETVAKLASLGYIGAGTVSTASVHTEDRLPSPRSKIEIHNRLGEARELAAAADLDGAERVLREILRSDPGVIDAHTALGNILLRQKRYAEAAAAFRRALDRKPVDPMLALGLATAELEDGKPEAAESTLRESLKFNPTDSRHYFLLGTIADGRGETAKAETYFAKVRELDPGSSSVESALAEVAFRKGDFTAAENHIASALAKDPKTRGAHYYRARILENRGDQEGAIREFLKEAEIEPRDSRTFSALLALYRKTGRLEEEQRFLEMVIDRRPDFPGGYLYLSKNYLDRGLNLPVAAELAKKAIALEPQARDRALGYFLLADIYSRLGDLVSSGEYAKKGRIAAAVVR
jgi:arylsulfatase A-like enzyme/Flp pilus assembly protein TadD